MGWGLVAALCWGLADLTAAISGRRIGSLLTVGVAQVVGLVVILAIGLLGGERFHATTTQAAFLIGDGIFAAIAYIALYRALELGPVALVSPVVAAYSAITVSLAVVLMHERVHGVLLMGILVTLSGVVLASANLKVLRATGFRLDQGVRLAIASMVLFGVATFVVGYFSQQVGWYSASFYARVGNCVGVGFFLLVLARGRVIKAQPSFGPLAVAAGIGLVDVLGLVTYAEGTASGMVSRVSAAASAFILIPVLGGLLLFRERPSRSQLVGVAMVGAGLLLLGSS